MITDRTLAAFVVEKGYKYAMNMAMAAILWLFFTTLAKKTSLGLTGYKPLLLDICVSEPVSNKLGSYIAEQHSHESFKRKYFSHEGYVAGQASSLKEVR